MTIHKHWSAPAQEAPASESPTPVAPTPAPTITHVWLAVYRDDCNEDTMRIFSSEESCQKWRQAIAGDNWNLDEDTPEDAEDMANAYFEFNDDESLNYWQELIRR